MLLFYDSLIFLCSAYIFLIMYRGGGVLKLSDSIKHMIVAALCVLIPRLVGNIYRQIWRYGGVQSYMRLIVTDTIGGICYEFINLAVPIKTITTSRVISIFAVNMLGCLVIRMSYRYCFKYARQDTAYGRLLSNVLCTFAGKDIIAQRGNMRRRQKIAIVGAGRVGVSLAEELLNNSQAYSVPVCFIDIREDKIGRQIHGFPVLDENQVTVELLNDYDVDQIVFAIPSLNISQKKRLYEQFQEMGYPIKIYDFPLMQTAGAKRQLRSFEVEEVLFRSPITVTDEQTTAYYAGKVILVTGGGGSIGSELSRQVAAMKPKQLILLDIYENGVYDVQQELRMKYGQELDLRIEIVSITNRQALEQVFRTYRPQIVINAAAHKHVPLMEHNCIEAVCNNVFGTKYVVELCEEYDVERFMTLSTDKAVNPTNVMGATKRMCEFIMQAYSTSGKVRYSATRFGNVLGSAGSVIPLFKRQIAAGGPITITHREIIRYFMTIPEASQLVLQSGAMARNGELFVLDMGEPVKILDLAENMIRLSGLVPYKDINIIETGLRPGEKLYEELLVSGQNLDKTANDLIFIEREEPLSMTELEEKLSILQAAAAGCDNEKMKEALRQVVPTFHRPEEVNGIAGGM